ncbi:thymidylate synthase [Bombilactobacillus thymidiniphilus]|uniref:Thymidylate synthase n=1 Tax=Bombilactobacillus thymidiniphilus TaxID=2923363 RepID=A0ABY4PF07_9LACO|nr:thymidylate synthase [Bombilactobacillus thymidiniphilus]UQS84393.1 thymidylate synthase [Bombilactobacillus thymidiniphilus]
MNEQQYLNMLQTVLQHGHHKNDRTNTGTISLFGYQLRFDLQDSFPLLTTKKVPFSLIKSELIWFLRGDTNIRFLLKHNNHIWDEWAFENYVKSAAYQGPDMTDFGQRSLQDPIFAQQYYEQKKLFCERILADDDFAVQYGDLGEVYGKQWRKWPTANQPIDQIADVIEQIKTNPNSRRLIISAWNPGELAQMALPPCHTLFQFYVNDGTLSCQLYQRSADMFLGVPFNIASYALLTQLIAKVTNLKVGEFIHTFGDAHIYQNHVEQVKLQLQRPLLSGPQLWLDPQITSLDNLQMEQIKVNNYHYAPAIKAPVAV